MAYSLNSYILRSRQLSSECTSQELKKFTSMGRLKRQPFLLSLGGSGWGREGEGERSGQGDVCHCTIKMIIKLFNGSKRSPTWTVFVAILSPLFIT